VAPTPTLISIKNGTSRTPSPTQELACFARTPSHTSIFTNKGRCGTDPYNNFHKKRDGEDAVPYTKIGVLRKDAVPYTRTGVLGKDTVPYTKIGVLRKDPDPYSNFHKNG